MPDYAERWRPLLDGVGSWRGDLTRLGESAALKPQVRLWNLAPRRLRYAFPSPGGEGLGVGGTPRRNVSNVTPSSSPHPVAGKPATTLPVKGRVKAVNAPGGAA
jgi:hypothetical protein